MTDILERLRLMHYRFAAESEDDAARRRVQTAKDAAEEIKKLRAAIFEWAVSIYGYEGVLFLEGLQHEKFINSILDAERDRVEGEQKE